jgi:lysophospholipase L1-like esterase
MKLLFISLSLCLLLACKKNVEPARMITSPQSAPAMKYLALGDSYTIGESVTEKESFPYQLTAQLAAKGLIFLAPKVIARTGWTTGELQSAINADAGIASPYDLVTLLIGVNNQYRGNSIVEYRAQFKILLQQAIGFAGGNKRRVFVVSIPDWGVTPFGKGSGRNTQTVAQEIDSFNAVNKEETLAMGVVYTDITPGSRLAANDLTLVANDGLHPSGKMYGNWATDLTPKVVAIF